MCISCSACQILLNSKHCHLSKTVGMANKTTCSDFCSHITMGTGHIGKLENFLYMYLFCPCVHSLGYIMGGRGVHPLLSSVSLLDFFLRMVSLVSPEPHFYHLRTHLFFRGRVSEEENNLKLVLYITLLHTYKTLQHKTKLTLSVFQ